MQAEPYYYSASSVEYLYPGAAPSDCMQSEEVEELRELLKNKIQELSCEIQQLKEKVSSSDQFRSLENDIPLVAEDVLREVVKEIIHKLKAEGKKIKELIEPYIATIELKNNTLRILTNYKDFASYFELEDSDKDLTTSYKTWTSFYVGGNASNAKEINGKVLNAYQNQIRLKLIQKQELQNRG